MCVLIQSSPTFPCWRPRVGGRGDDFVGGAGTYARACTCMSTHDIRGNTRASGATSTCNEARMSRTADAHKACKSGATNADEAHASGVTSACNEGHASGAANAPNTHSAAYADVHAPTSPSHSPVGVRPQPVVGCCPQAGVLF